MSRSSSRNLECSPEHRKILTETAFTDRSPGTIVEDFEVLLEYLRQGDLPISVTHQLPIRVLPEINARLTHPLESGLRRPLQKSYPHLNGLYLLVRASGLTCVGGTGKKPLLSVDEAIYQSWQGLNPAERYCTLLDTWLLRGQPEIIGESGRGQFLMLHNLQESRDFFEKIPKKGLKVAGNRDAEYLLPYLPGWCRLALLELFGLITVCHARPVEGKAWSIESICLTPFGDALVTVLINAYVEDWGHSSELEDKGKVRCGVLQPVLQPFFTSWKNNLTVPEWVFREGTHIFKVSLGQIWRRIAIPADLTLDALATTILRAVKFDNDHLYMFSYRNRFGALEQVYHPEMDEGPWADEMLVGEAPLPVGYSMVYLYDFGDEWKFEVTLEAVDPLKAVKKPVILEKHGGSPRQYPRWD